MICCSPKCSQPLKMWLEVTNNLCVSRFISKNSLSKATRIAEPTYFPSVLWLRLCHLCLHIPDIRVNRSCCASPLKAFDLDLVSSPALSQSAFRAAFPPLVPFLNKLPGIPGCSAGRDSTGLYFHSARQCCYTVTDIRDSVLDQFGKPKMRFMDSLFFLSLWLFLFLSIYFFNSVSLILSLALSHLLLPLIWKNIIAKRKGFFFF